jgi:hypothetical protein
VRIISVHSTLKPLIAVNPKFRVRVTLGACPGNIELFTPNASMQWGECQFEVNPPEGGEYDFWIVFGNALGEENALVAPENTLFISGEPPAKKTYPHAFYGQFGHVVDTHSGSKHPNLVVDALGLCWLVGLNWDSMSFDFGYDYLKNLKRPEKINKIGVVCSSTAQTAGQRARLKFLSQIKEELGDSVVHFGKGFEPIRDKMDGILPYRFHLVLENSQSPHYWTEKLTDAYLGWAYPFYVGCPNLQDYFDPASYLAVDLKDPKSAASLMRDRLSIPETQEEMEVIGAAREATLERYNPFARFDYWVRKFYEKRPRSKMIIRSAKKFRWRNRLNPFCSDSFFSRRRESR